MPESIEYNQMKEEDLVSNFQVDICNEKCPYTFIRAKLALEEIPIGEVLKIYLDNPMALNNLPKAFIYQGQEYIDTERLEDNKWIIRIRRLR